MWVKQGYMIKKIKELPTVYFYFLFFFVSYISVYFSFIADKKIRLGHDSSFHLGRIEALYTAILNGDFIPTISHYFIRGMGYASSIFYPDLFLYPAAILRLAGFTKAGAYVYYILLVTFLTFLIAYHSFYSFSKSREKSLFFALLYGLSSYRIADVVVRAALGEVLAFMVLPIAFVGIIQLVQGDEKKFYVLALGMALLFYAHMLSTFIFCLFIMGYLLLNSRVLLKERYRLLYLIYAAVLTIMLVAMSLFPIIEQLSFQKLKVVSEPLFFLQESSTSISEMLMSAFVEQEYNNLGWFIFLAIILLLLRMKKLTSQNRQFLFLGVLFLFLATNIFPHYLFHETIFNSIQFPWRYFLVVTIAITWTFADSFSQLIFCKKVLFGGLIITILLISDIQAQFGSEHFRIYYNSLREFPTTHIGAGMEYLPANMEYSKVINKVKVIQSDPEDVEISEFKQNYDVITFKYRAEKLTKVTLPKVFYKGYVVEVNGSGMSSLVSESQKYKGLSELKLSGEGQVKFWYKGTIIQKLSLSLSAVTWSVLVAFSMKKLYQKGYHKNASAKNSE